MEKNNYQNDSVMGEVLDEIQSATEDPRGLVSHQRRLSFSLSLGCSKLIENFFIGKNILKSGARVDHRWLKKKKETAKEHLSRQITANIEDIKNIDEIIDLAFEIESERNLISYGKKVDESVLQDKINLFFKLKEIVKND